MLKKLTRILYKGARVTNDADALLSGDPKKMFRRLHNKFMGRNISSRMNRKGKR